MPLITACVCWIITFKSHLIAHCLSDMMICAQNGETTSRQCWTRKFSRCSRADTASLERSWAKKIIIIIIRMKCVHVAGYYERLNDTVCFAISPTIARREWMKCWWTDERWMLMIMMEECAARGDHRRWPLCSCSHHVLVCRVLLFFWFHSQKMTADTGNNTLKCNINSWSWWKKVNFASEIVGELKK